MAEQNQSVIERLKVCRDGLMPLGQEEVLACFHGLAEVTKKSGLLLNHLLRLNPDELARRGDNELQLYLDLRDAVESLGQRDV